jgi:ribosomal-protein-alanine N-acetyltransferase
VKPVIRHAGPEATELLAGLHAKAFDSTEIWDRSAFDSLLDGPGLDALVASDDEMPLGFILIRTIAGEAEILTLAVLPAARRAGTGRALVEAGLDAARVRGAQRAFLEVSVNNMAALALYRSTGWDAAGHRTRYYKDGSDALVLSRTL